MTHSDIALRRLHNQHLTNAVHAKPDDEVRWLGAVQSQDYAAAKWALGQRLRDATDAVLDRAFDEGAILRTHLMRPTWHFVAREDIRWMIDLTGPRVLALNAHYERKLGLDLKLFKRSNAAIAKALRDGEQLTREELRPVLERAGVDPGDGMRLAYLMMRAELDGIVCSGARRGKQFTYALIDDRAPDAIRLPREEALAELATRFFASHGPATVHDFAKWSGLTVADAARGLDGVKGRFDSAELDGATYWFTEPGPEARRRSTAAYLLPNYDEYTIGYRDHAAVFDKRHLGRLLYGHTVVIDGRVAGTWRRTLKKDRAVLDVDTFAPLNAAAGRALASAARRYGAFLGVAVVVA